MVVSLTSLLQQALREADLLRAAKEKAEEEARSISMKRQESVRRREVESVKQKVRRNKISVLSVVL